MRINSSEISVVIQGPINEYTSQCIESTRKNLPKSKIILSTWKGQNVSGLDFDELIESNDPGYTYTILDTFEPGHIRTDSTNRQIVSTLAGLRISKTKYAIKMRSDLLITSDNFISYYENYSDLPADDEYKILTNRILALSTCNPKRRHKFPFTLPDWFIFGETRDLVKIFDIPFLETRQYRQEYKDNRKVLHAPYSTEQYIWLSFLSKYKDIPFMFVNDTNGVTISLSEKYFANNCILLPAKLAGINWLKYPGAAYAQLPALSNTGLYTWNEYLQILNRYADCSLPITWNPIEKLTYFVVYNGRHLIKNLSPSLHDLIARTVNPSVHKKLDMLKSKK